MAGTGAGRDESDDPSELRFLRKKTDDGLPLLDDALTSFVCRFVSIHPAGDHSLFVGLVEHLDYKPGLMPLLFFSGSYRSANLP
jgi:flavin reductase (DIM6/NTAB) family NADH-FMN oxidoreductase RutF